MVTTTDTGKYRLVSGTRHEVVTQLEADGRKPEDVIQFEYDAGNTEHYALYQLR